MGVDPALNLTRMIPATAAPAFQQLMTALEQRLYNPNPRPASLTNVLNVRVSGGGGANGHNYTNRKIPLTASFDPKHPASSKPKSVAVKIPGRRRPPPLPPSTVSLAEVTVPLIVRGDITFFRQDFSVTVPLGPGLGDLFPANLPPPLGYSPGPGGTPAVSLPTRPVVRYDYMVRTRSLTPAEAAKWKETTTDRPVNPQREAALFALRELTGKDAGSTMEAWQELFPRSAIDVEAGELRRYLKSADKAGQAILLAQWSNQSGEVRTAALASLLPSFKGELQEKAREVVVRRLARLDADALRKRLTDGDDELRRAAIAACARKKDKGFIPDLIAALKDAEPVDALVIEDALASLTGEKLEGAEEWRSWWEGLEKE